MDRYAKVSEQERIDLIASTGMDEHVAHIFLLVLGRLGLSQSRREAAKQEALTIALRDGSQPVAVLREMFSQVASGHG